MVSNGAIGKVRRSTSPRRGLCFGVLVCAGGVYAQGNNQTAQTSPRAQAPIDLAGIWVAVVSEDWRVRMTMGQKGDWEFIGLNRDGIAMAEAAEPESEDPCMAYGAAGIMRIPTRLQIGWEDESTLRIDTDAGMQSRLLRFDAEPSALTEPTRQGFSAAEWQSGELRVVTTNMLPGFYFKHGVPYSADATMTEYVALIPDDRSADYLFFTAVVEDPRYLSRAFVRTLTFKRERDDSGWNPEPCTVP